MNGENIKEAICKMIDEKDCFTFFWENFNGDIDALISELEKNKVNFLIISIKEYMNETFKYMESIKTDGVPSNWAFRDKIRSLDWDVLFIYGYETIGLNQELFETMATYDIDCRKGLLTKTVIVTRGKFDSVICERFKNRMNASTFISC